MTGDQGLPGVEIGCCGFSRGMKEYFGLFNNLNMYHDVLTFDCLIKEVP